ncbi:MAG: hypothetical protein AB8B62_01765 [Roseobacter sp.]
MMRTLAILACLAGPAFADQVTAVEFLAEEQIAIGCQSGKGTLTPDGLREVDLNNDGRLDLILDHAGMVCDGTGMFARSTYCGVQVCSIYFYIRDENGLLVFNDEVLGLIDTISDAKLPVISGIAHGGDTWSVVWSGNRFELTQ